METPSDICISHTWHLYTGNNRMEWLTAYCTCQVQQRKLMQHQVGRNEWALSYCISSLHDCA